MKKTYQRPPQEPTQPTPSITPAMLERAFEALERKGMIYYSEGGVYIPTAKGWQLLMTADVTSVEIIAHGNPKITATNASMIKLTNGNDVDDATIGVRANKACADFPEDFKRAIKTPDKNLEIVIESDDEMIAFSAYCSPALKLIDSNHISINKTDLIDDKTVAIVSDKAAADLDRDFVEKLKDPNSKIKVVLGVK